MIAKDTEGVAALWGAGYFDKPPLSHFRHLVPQLNIDVAAQFERAKNEYLSNFTSVLKKTNPSLYASAKASGLVGKNDDDDGVRLQFAIRRLNDMLDTAEQYLESRKFIKPDLYAAYTNGNLSWMFSIPVDPTGTTSVAPPVQNPPVMASRPKKNDGITTAVRSLIRRGPITRDRIAAEITQWPFKDVAGILSKLKTYGEVVQNGDLWTPVAPQPDGKYKPVMTDLCCQILSAIECASKPMSTADLIAKKITTERSIDVTLNTLVRQGLIELDTKTATWIKR